MHIVVITDRGFAVVPSLTFALGRVRYEGYAR